MKQELVIDCPHCAVRIKTHADSYVVDESEQGFFLVQCSSCRKPLFGTARALQDEWMHDYWDTVERLWPDPPLSHLSSAIPEAARRDITEAQKCHSYGIYSAAAVLCGRALERLIKEKTGGKPMIAQGLKKLLEGEVIDQRLFDWAEALRKERNLGAHASDEETTSENARDVISFTVAIFDYVYTLTAKYADYIARQRKST